MKLVLFAAAVVLYSPTVRGGVVAYVESSAGNFGANFGWGANVTGSGPQQAYAVSRAFNNQTTYTESGGTNPNLVVPCSLPCASEGLVFGDGVTGAVRVYGGSGLYPNLGGQTTSTVEITDSITFNSPAPLLTVDFFYDQLYTTYPAGQAPVWQSKAFHQVDILLATNAGDLVYVASIAVDDTYTSGTGSRSYSICDGVTFPCVDGANPPVSNGHLGFAVPLDLSAYVGTPLTLTYRVTDETLCNYSVNFGDCASIVDSLHTSYLGIQGQFTSQNGYQYLGAPAGSAVPEPGTYALIGVALTLGSLVRRRSRRGVNLRSSQQHRTR